MSVKMQRKDQRTNRCHVPDWWRSGAGRSIGNGDGGGGTDGIVAEQCHFSKTFPLSQRDQMFPKVRVVFRGTQQCSTTGFVILNQLVGVVVLCGGRKENKRRETEERKKGEIEERKERREKRRERQHETTESNETSATGVG